MPVPLRRLSHDLLESLVTEPIEDGVTHASESILRTALQDDQVATQAWLKEQWRRETNAGLLAALMKCVGRLTCDETLMWGLEIADISLKHPDVEVRDAAVQALELWGGTEAADLLRQHSEEVGWLRKYIAQILSELE